MMDLGAWSAVTDTIHILYAGDCTEENMLARVAQDVDPHGAWFYSTVVEDEWHFHFPSVEAAKAAAEDTLRAASERAARKILRFPIELCPKGEADDPS